MTQTTNWQPDPWGIHELRFFSSDGKPTLLVMDGGTTSYDKPPPSEPLIDSAPPSLTPQPSLIDPVPNRAEECQEPVSFQDLPAVSSTGAEPATVVSEEPTAPAAKDHAPEDRQVQIGSKPFIPVTVIHPTPGHRPVSDLERREAEPLSRGLKVTYGIVLSVLAVSALGLLYVHVHHSGPGLTKHRSATPSTVSSPHGTSTTTSLAVPAAPRPSAEAAAQALVSSWATGDRASALAVATNQAVADLFAHSYSGGSAIDRGCSTAFTPIVCTFGPPGGASPSAPIYQFLVSQASGGWFVSSVKLEN